MTNNTADFQREERYLVVKLSDFHTEQDEEAVRGWLRKFGVPTRQCVVVEHDWPIYEPVWDMVQRLVEGRNQKVDELQAHILNLNSIIHRLSCYPEDCDDDDYRHSQNVIGSCPDEGDHIYVAASQPPERGAEWEEITGGEYQRIKEAVKDQKAEDYL